jgi:hypothetical protein
MKLKWIAVALPVALIALALLIVVPAYSFLPSGVASGSAFSPSSWPTPPVWVINSSVTGANIAGNSQDVTDVMTAAFSTWIAAPNTSLGVSSTPGGTSNATTPQTSENLVCFICTGVDFSTDGTLALTITTTDSSGAITSANILFNPNPVTGDSSASPICFTTADTSATCPQPNSVTQDMQTIAVHEIGHFFGLDHSAIVRAIMYPYAPPILTTLSYDDVAGISLLYPSPAPQVQTGSISGQVTLSGVGVFGAHVFANSTTSANPFSSFLTIRKTPIGTLTFPDGSYMITGLPADSYEVIAEPLDLPVNNSNVSWSTEWSQPNGVQTNFTTRWH